MVKEILWGKVSGGTQENHAVDEGVERERATSGISFRIERVIGKTPRDLLYQEWVEMST